MGFQDQFWPQDIQSAGGPNPKYDFYFPEKVVYYFIVFWDAKVEFFTWKLRRAGRYFTKLSQGMLGNSVSCTVHLQLFTNIDVL